MSLDFYLETSNGEELFWRNITHNLGRMAEAAGIYYVLWRPDESGYKVAVDVISTLKTGLERLEKDPDHFREFDSPNGWGTYEHFVLFVRDVITACETYPDAVIRVSR